MRFVLLLIVVVLIQSSRCCESAEEASTVSARVVVVIIGKQMDGAPTSTLSISFFNNDSASWWLSYPTPRTGQVKFSYENGLKYLSKLRENATFLSKPEDGRSTNRDLKSSVSILIIDQPGKNRFLISLDNLQAQKVFSVNPEISTICLDIIRNGRGKEPKFADFLHSSNPESFDGYGFDEKSENKSTGLNNASSEAVNKSCVGCSKVPESE